MKKLIRNMLCAVLAAAVVCSMAPSGLAQAHQSRRAPQYKVELDAPTSLAVSFTGPSQARLTWASVRGARTYEIQYSTDRNTWRKPTPSISSKTSATARRLTRNGTYYFRVRARNNSNRQLSDWALSGPATKPSYTPATPANLTAAFTDGTTARLTWSATASATSYQVQYSTNNSRWMYERPLTIKQTNFTSRGLKLHNTYYFRVRARGAYGKYSPWSASVSCTKNIAKPPVAPSSFSAVFTDDTTARVSWSVVTGASAYEAQYSHNNSDWYGDGGSSTTSTSGTFTRLNDYGTYYFRVRARNTAGQYSEWKYSGAVVRPSAAPLYAPRNLTAVFVDASSARLSWSPVESAYNYDVQYSSDSYGWYDENPPRTASNSFLSTNLVSYNTYYFRVRAVDSYGRYSDWSYSGACVKGDRPSDNGSYGLFAPADLSAAFVDATSALLSWSAVNAASHYDVQYSFDDRNWYDENPATTTTTSFLSTNLNSYDTYYYRVRAKDLSGRYSEWRYVSCSKSAAALNVSWRNWDVGHSNEASQDLTVTSNTRWNASGIPDWVRLSVTSGTGTQTVRVTVDRNTGTASRTGTFTIEAGNLRETVAVTQMNK